MLRSFNRTRMVISVFTSLWQRSRLCVTFFHSTPFYWLTYLLTYLLHGAESFLRSEMVFRQSRNSPHFTELISSLPHSPILNQLYPVHISRFHSLKLHLIIVFPFTPGSTKWSLSLTFPHQNPVYASPPPLLDTRPAHLILLDFITWTILVEEYRSLSSSL